MTLKLRKFFRRLSAVTLVGVTAAAVVSSCDSFVYDDLDPCPQGVRLRFVYDYNMEFANAFPSQVDCLTLLVYDGNGKYVTTRTVTDDALLSDENWRMLLDIPAGKYTMLAYGGMACPDASFAFQSDPGVSMPVADVEVNLRPASLTSPVGTQLHNLFYGRLEMEIPAGATDYTEATVTMMKDTNNLRVVLQHVDGSPVDNGDFNFAVRTDNTSLDWKNDIIPTSVVSYCPWARGQAVAGVDAATGDRLEVAYAEFSTSRFVVSNDCRLEITLAEDNRNVLSIPLIDYLLLLKSQEFSRMGSQEFLDRESRWDMIFFLDGDNRWISTQIVVNGWVVRINDFEA